MPKRYSDLERKALEGIESQIDIAAAPIEDLKANSCSNSEYGLCSTCKNFIVTRSRYRIIRALCSRYEDDHLFYLKSNEPVVECTDFKDRFEMSLYDMQRIAYIIESDTRKIGFIESDGTK